jgi:MacB-like periplasmic core domain
VNAVLLRPLPFPNSDQLVSVQYFDTLLKATHESTSYPDFFDLRSQNQVFTDMAAFHYGSYALPGVEQPAHLNGQIVTSGFFSTLQVAPDLGRGFLRQEEQRGRHAVVLSDSLWVSQFGADPRVVGLWRPKLSAHFKALKTFRDAQPSWKLLHLHESSTVPRTLFRNANVCDRDLDDLEPLGHGLIQCGRRDFDGVRYTIHVLDRSAAHIAHIGSALT